MYSSSRRKNSYDRQLKKFQNRNIVAGIILAAAFGFAIWLMLAVMAGNTPKVYLSTNYVEYSGTQKEIPFATESCQLLVDSLGEELKFLEQSTPLELDSDTSQLKISKNVRDNDVLLVYFNGHLVRGKDAPVEYLPAGRYEGDAQRADFGKLLGNVNESGGKIKIVLIDAGRYTRSPVFPARELNNFQEALAEAMARNHYGLDDNVWVIVSHSKNELSRATTVMESTLFAQAIAATVKQFAAEEVRDISVPDFYEKIRGRTTAWSRNLKGNATQMPLLMSPGKGIVFEDGKLADLTELSQPEEEYVWKVAFNDDKENARDNNKNEQDTGEQVFRQIQSGEQAAERLLSRYRYDAMPLKTMGDLESFLELGSPVEIVNQTEIAQYNHKLNQPPDRSSGKILVDENKLTDKRQTVKSFRRAVLGVSLLSRFRNELVHWENDEILRYLDEFRSDLPKLTTIADSQLTRNETPPPSYTLYVKAFDDFYRSHLPLVDEVKLQVKSVTEKQLTPTQAEMLGRMTERYLPLLDRFEPVEDKAKPTVEPTQATGKAERSPTTFSLDLTPNTGKARFGDLNTGIEDLYNERSGAYGSEFEAITNDTAFRILLAAQGSEAATNADRFQNFQAIAPQIVWTPIDPKINFIRLLSGTKNARVNPTAPVPVEIEIDVQAIDWVELKLAPTEGTDIGRLQYSFSENTVSREPKLLFRNLKDRKSFNLWFSNISFDAPDTTLPFKITATSNTGQETEIQFDVTLTKEADFVLVASRELGKAVSTEGLFRWGRRDFPNDSPPLMVKSLANIKSVFQLAVQNQSSKRRNLQFKLYNIRADECEVPGLRPDRPDGFAELSGWLAKTPPLSPLPKSFKLIGQTEDVLIAPKSELIALNFEPSDPEKDENGKVEDGFAAREVPHALLLVGSDMETGEKEWFQWLGYETQITADYTANDTNDANLLRPLNDIIEGIELDRSFEGDRQAEVQRMLKRAWPKEMAVAELDVVSPSTGRAALSRPRLFLEGIFSNGKLDPGKVRGDDERILVMNLFGVPGYRILRQSDVGVVGAISRDLVGVRLDTEGSGCVSHPATWSLLNYDASGRTEEKIFLRNDPKEKANPVLGFELLLPSFKRDAVAKEPTDFIVKWNGRREKLLFPNHRVHFVQFTETGLAFQSAVSDHRLARVPLGNISDDSVLQVISNVVGREQVIGSWRFIRESQGNKPILSLSADTISKVNLNDVKVTADFSKISPPVDLPMLELAVNGLAIEKFFKQKFAKSNSDGIYRFNLADLTEMVDFKVDTYRLEIAATDFFGERYAVSKTLQIEKDQEAPLIAVKVKPKIIHSVQLRFVDKKGNAIPVPKSKIRSMAIKGMPGNIQWNKRRENTGEVVAAWKKDGSLKLFNLPEGETTFVIGIAMPGNPNIANSPDEVVQFEKTEEIDAEGQVVDISFDGK